MTEKSVILERVLNLRNYLRRYTLLIAGTVMIVVSDIDGGIARAENVYQAGSLAHRAQVSAEGRRPSIIRRSVNTAGCQPVTTTSAVQSDLSEVTPVATGCDIGIYVEPAAKNVVIEDVAVHDATRAGIVVDSAQCTTLFADTIYITGDHPQGGVQYGFAILTEGAKNVALDYVSAYLYQKNGFNIRHSTGSVNLNSVIGEGPIGVPPAALNGFEFLNYKLTSVFGNRTELNQYTGPTYGGSGYLLFCTSVQNHVLTSSSSDQKKFERTWQNLEAFDDISYYSDPTARCNGT